MNKRLVRVVDVGLLAVLAVSPGCATATGAVIGASVKSPSKAMRWAPASDVRALQPGQHVALHLKDGSRAVGEFSSVAVRSAPEYARLYELGREADPQARRLPRLGPAEVLWARDRSGPAMVEYAGVDLGGVVLLEAGGAERTVSFETIDALRGSDGEAISGLALRSLVATGTVPLRSEIVLVAPERRVGAESVALVEVEVPVMKNKALTGALIGLTIDLFFLVYLLIYPPT